MTTHIPAQEDCNKEIEGFKASCKNSYGCCCRHSVGSRSYVDVISLILAYLGALIMTGYFIWRFS